MNAFIHHLVLKIIEKYQNDPSIKLIKAKEKDKSQTFRFRETNIDDIKKSVQSLDPKTFS